MPESELVSASYFFECDMDASEVHAIAGGEAALYTHRSPAKVTPNEDAVALLPIDAGRGVLAIADGVGGLPGGEQASRTALEELGRAVLDAAASGVSLRTGILNGIENANRCVLEGGAGATTLAVAEVAGSSVRTYHVGDSAILLTGQRGRVKAHTIPHSPVGYAVEAGLLDEAEAMVHEDRHLIANAIGSRDMRIEVGPQLRMAQLDTLVLASDGLSDNLYLSEIIEAVRKGGLPRVGMALSRVRESRMERPGRGKPSKPDDLSFIVFRQGSHRSS